MENKHKLAKRCYLAKKLFLEIYHLKENTDKSYLEKEVTCRTTREDGRHR